MPYAQGGVWCTEAWRWWSAAEGAHAEEHHASHLEALRHAPRGGRNEASERLWGTGRGTVATLPIEHKLYWLLRLGVIGCFIGHGAYGFITKEAWVPYFGVVGIDRTWAYWLMPWIGAMDVSLGVTT
jgi:hypothetical protein